MIRTVNVTALSLLLLSALAGCEPNSEGVAAVDEMPVFGDAELAAGRTVWMGTCRNCHLLGIAGAPSVTNFPEWDRRLARGKTALYQSALSGIRGEDGLYRMPPYGGNRQLSADQIRLAVDYKIAAIERLRRLAN